MKIGRPQEPLGGDSRVAVTPETAKKLHAQGHELRVESARAR